ELRVRTKDDRIYTFSKAPASVNQQGLVEFPISLIADLSDNWLQFHRRNGRLVGIDESSGRRVDIETDDGRIARVGLRVPGTEVNHTFVRYRYDSDGNLIAAMDAVGNACTFAYTEHRVVRHADRNGLSFYYEYDQSHDAGWRVKHAWGDGGLYNYRFEYVDVL